MLPGQEFRHLTDGRILEAGSVGNYYDVRDFGTYDSAATATVNTATAKQAIVEAYNAGGGTVVVPRAPAAAYYQMGRSEAAVQTKGCFHLLPGVSLVSNGARIQLNSANGAPVNCAFVTASSVLSTTAATTVTADTTVATTNLTVTSSANFAAGNDVYVRLGQAAYDAAEPEYWFFATVSAIPDATHITLDRPCGYAMSVAATTDVLQRKITRIDQWYENAFIGDFEFLATTSNPSAIAEFGVSLLYSRNVKIGRITATNPGASIVGGQWTENVDIDVLSVKNSDAMSSTAHGRGFWVAECRNWHIGTAALKDCQDWFVVAESGAKNITIDDLIIDNAYNGVRTNAGIITTLYKSQVSIGSLVLRGNLMSTVHEQGGVTSQGTNALSIDMVVDQTGGATHSNVLTNQVSRSLTVDGVTYNRVRTWTKRIALTASMSSVATTAPSGYARSCRVFASSTMAGLTKFALKAGAETATAHASIVANTSATLANVEQMTLNHNLTTAKSIIISTSGAGAGFLIVELEYWEDASGTVLQTTYDSTGLLQ